MNTTITSNHVPSTNINLPLANTKHPPTFLPFINFKEFLILSLFVILNSFSYILQEKKYLVLLLELMNYFTLA